MLDSFSHKGYFNSLSKSYRSSENHLGFA